MSDVAQEAKLAAAQARWRQILSGQFSVLKTLRAHHQDPHLFLSPENLRNNRAVGNNLCAKSPEHTRFFGHNVNGLRLDSEGGDFTQLCRVMKAIQADVIGITEHNVDTTKHYVQQLCYTALRDNLPR